MEPKVGSQKHPWLESLHLRQALFALAKAFQLLATTLGIGVSAHFHLGDKSEMS